MDKINNFVDSMGPEGKELFAQRQLYNMGFSIPVVHVLIYKLTGDEEINDILPIGDISCFGERKLYIGLVDSEYKIENIINLVGQEEFAKMAPLIGRIYGIIRLFYEEFKAKNFKYAHLPQLHVCPVRSILYVHDTDIYFGILSST